MMDRGGRIERARLRQPDGWICRTTGDDHGGCGSPVFELMTKPDESLAPLDAAADLVRRLAESSTTANRALARCLHDAAHRPRGRRVFWFVIARHTPPPDPAPWAPCRDGADGTACTECRALAEEAIRAAPGRGADDLVATMADDVRAYLLAIAARPLPFDLGYEPLAGEELPAALREARRATPRHAALSAAWERAVTAACETPPAADRTAGPDAASLMHTLTLGIDARLALDLSAAAAGGMDPASAIDAAERLLRRA